MVSTLLLLNLKKYINELPSTNSLIIIGALTFFGIIAELKYCFFLSAECNEGSTFTEKLPNE